MKAIKMSQRKVSTGSFTLKTFSRASATMVLVICAHSRTLVLNDSKLRTVQAQLTSETDQNKLKILAHDIAQAIGTRLQKSISQESVGTPPKRQLAPQTSRASTLMTSDEEEEDPDNASNDADATAIECKSRGTEGVL